MKKILHYLPLHFVACLILGISAQFYTQFWKFNFSIALSILIVFLFLLMVIQNKVIRTLVSFLLFFTVGVSTVFVNDNSNSKNYYKHHLNDNATIILKVNKVLKPSTYHHKYEVEVLQVNNIKTKGKVLLNIVKDSTNNYLEVDELLYAKPNFKAIPKPLNPHQFNYKLYLQKQGIHQQVYLNKTTYKSLGILRSSLIGLSAKFRSKVQQSLKKHQFTVDELAVINALLLGQRQEISKELINNYSRAGAIHILAVSGLHVGILLWILTWLLKPIERLKKGKIIKTLLIVFLLWMFAFIAGLSASVVRAVTMFTFMAVGLSFKRKNMILFSLISSMFFLLVFKPMFLFDVGFQLSYLAVFGIIFIQPKLYGIYEPKYWVDKKIWEITTVSLAAQIGVLPLSLYYFHQFPSLFMLSNLVIIPFLGAILVGGIVIIILSLIGILPQFLASIYGEIIATMNAFVSWISHQERFLFEEISLSLVMVLVVYTTIIWVCRFLIKRAAIRLTYILVGIVLIQSVYFYENYQKKRKTEFIVFHKSKSSIVANRIGEKLRIHHNLDSLEFLQSKILQLYTIGENIETDNQTKISNFFQSENQQIVVIDSLGVYKIQNLKNPIVILQQSPKINLERMIKTLVPKQIVADGSNYKSYVKKWQETAKKQKTPFHYTGKDGAFVY